MARSAAVCVRLGLIVGFFVSLGFSIDARAQFLEVGGQVVIEAENFSENIADATHTWELIDGATGSFSNARGDYMQSLPNDNTNNNNNDPFGDFLSNSPLLNYDVRISTPGDYQMFLRWGGETGSDDSIYGSIVDLRDGAGGAPDWYRFEDAADDTDFATEPWDGVGELEGVSGSGNDVDAVWNIASPGDYTLQVIRREDGSAIDSLILQSTSLPAPTGDGPPESPQAAGARILFHGSGVEPVDGADGAVMTHLQDRYGADNVVYMQGDMAAADGSDANGFDVVIISSTLSSGTVRNKYEDTPVGLMNWEQALMRQREGEFNMSENGRTQPDETQIEIVDPAHPIAAGLSGTIDVYSAPNTNSYGRDALAPGATLIARGVTDAADLAIFAAEAGDALLGDGTPGNPATADGRRVMFFLEDNGFGAITPDGIKMFDAAVDWLAVPEPSSMVLGLAGLLGLLGLSRRGRCHI